MTGPQQPEQPIVLPQECAPAPVPLAFIVQVDSVNKLIALWCMDCTGQRVMFMSPDIAAGLVSQLEEGITLARTGLVLAPANGRHAGPINGVR